MVIYVDPNGSDTNDGSIDKPVRQLGPAIAMAKQGDAIQVNPGEYSYAHVKDITFSADAPLVISAPMSGVVFDGDPEAHGAAAIRFEQSSGIRLYDIAINAPLTQVGILCVKCSSIHVKNCSVAGVNYIGIAVRKSSSCNVEACSIDSAACGIQMISSSNSNITGCTVAKAIKHGICLENVVDAIISGNNIECQRQGISCSSVHGSPFGGNQSERVFIDANIISDESSDSIREARGVSMGKNKFNEVVALLSFPRSGNSWCRYILEHVTLSKITDGGAAYVPDLPFNRGAFIGKTHRSRSITTHDSVLFLLRNYKEAVIDQMEHYGLSGGIPFDGLLVHCDGETLKWSLRGFSTGTTVKHGQTTIPNYLELLEKFDACDKHKLLVYYEELMNNPGTEIARMTEFVAPGDAAAQKRSEDFMANLDRHIRRSRGLYSGGCKSKTTEFHKFKITAEQRVEWDNFIRNKNPRLYEKYLTRYAEKPV